MKLPRVSGYQIEMRWRTPQGAQKLGRCVIKCSRHVLFVYVWSKMGCIGKAKLMDRQRLLMMVRRCQNPNTVDSRHDENCIPEISDITKFFQIPAKPPSVS